MDGTRIGQLSKRDMERERYIAIDLKSFYASVECVERGLDPLTTCLVVADESRTKKTICLAATPAIKKYGVPGRARLFEVVQQIKLANSARRCFAPGRRLTGESCDTAETGLWEISCWWIIAVSGLGL